MDQNIDFAFEGFRIIRQKPILILFWGVVSLVLSGFMQWIMVTMLGPIMDQMMTMTAGATAATASTANVSAQLALLGKLLPMYGLILLASVIYYAVMNCAVFRAAFDSKDSGLGYLRLGGDELRQILVMILFFLLFMVIYIVALIAASIVGGIAAAVVSGGMGNSPAAVGIVFFVVMLLVLCPLVWFAVRMSFYTVHSFATGKIDLFGSWKFTKGRFWILFAGYLVMFVMACLVMALFWAIFMGVTAVLGMNGLSLFSKMSGLGGNVSYGALYSNPLMIGYTLCSAFFLSPLLIALFAGAPAAAYRGFTGRTLQAKAESVF